MNISALIPSGVSSNTAIAVCVIAFIAGLARGFSGFGSALIFMPLASSIIAPKLTAAVLLIIDFIAATPLIPNAWKHADRKGVAVMAVGSLIGIPLGTYALTQLDPVTTRWVITVFVLALLMLLISGWRYRGAEHPSLSVGVGTLSGFCSGLAQTGGPPIVAYWLGRPISSVVARANIMLFFAFADFFSAASYAVAGLISIDSIKFSLVVGPVYAFGVGIGAMLFGRASEHLFRRICYGLIALAAIAGLPLLDGVIR